MVSVHLFVASFLGWLQYDQHKVVESLREENRVLRAQLRSQRVQLTDNERRRLAVLGARLGRRFLAEVAELSRRTFCTFSGEFSSFTRHGIANGQGP